MVPPAPSSHLVQWDPLKIRKKVLRLRPQTTQTPERTASGAKPWGQAHGGHGPGGRTEQQGRGARQGWPHSAQGGLAGPWACTSTVP